MGKRIEPHKTYSKKFRKSRPEGENMLEEIREYVDAAELILVWESVRIFHKTGGEEQVIEAYETLAGF